MSRGGSIGRLDAVPDRYKSDYEFDANGNILAAQRYNDAGLRYDSLTYHYEKNGAQLLRNRLYHLNESTDGGYGDIGTDASAFHGGHADVNTLNNYQYDALGNLVKDKREQIDTILWTVAGKVKHISRTAGSTKPELWFTYGADGNRISKTVGDPMNGGFREWYLRDAQGNIMATYRYTNTTGAGPSLKVTERPVYGSSRIGSYTRQLELYHEPAVHAWPYLQPMQAPLKRYELTDHLGNVAAVVTGRLLPALGPGTQYQAELMSASLHEPFGLELTGMNWQSNASRWGFQNQIKDLELNTVHFKYREYRPAYGVFDRIDPLAFKYPYNSPYAFSENRVIDGIEFEGLEVVELNGGGTVEGPYANADQALGAALDEKGPDGAGTKSINLPDVVISGRSGAASEYVGGTTNTQPDAGTPGSNREAFGHAVAGLALEGAGHGVGKTTFRLFNMKGTNFSPKLYNGWKGGSAGQIKTYGLGKTIGRVGTAFGLYGMGESARDLISGEVPALEGSADFIMGGVGTFGGWIGGVYEVSYQGGNAFGPSTWYGDDDSKWFK